MKKLEIGLKNDVRAVADESRLAVSMGSGTLPVLATPAVAALMEQAACELVQPYLEDGITTVGTMIKITHIKATPCGADIRAQAILTKIDDRKYEFELEAFDTTGAIAFGQHERVAVKAELFMEKAAQRMKQ